MRLESKTAIVHGGAGAIGSAVARAYAREGAVVHLTGRTEPALAIVAQRIRNDGGAAHVAQLDVLDRQAVERHASAVAQTSGGVDSAHFVIATAAARHMLPRRSGVILVMAGGREAIPDLGASHVAWAALAGVCRQLASELGPHGIRVAWLLSPGSPASDGGDAPHGDTAQDRHERSDVDPDGSLLRRRPSYDDVANVAVFAASDWARTMTATEVNFTAGVVVD
jgi:3-oxoacyl-[acyl-carrier protein] reductase